MNRADIILKLKKEILPLQGFKSLPKGCEDIQIGPINEAFPNKIFPSAAVHELVSQSMEDAAATYGFLSALSSILMGRNGRGLWIGEQRTLFPPALLSFGIDPSRIIFVELKKETDRKWALEEALKCEGLSTVMGEISDMDFTDSRRFQLAVERSRVTGFIVRRNLRKLSATTCIARWKIEAIKSFLDDDLPGVGFPRWRIELQKIRNGRPGSWDVEWKSGRFHSVEEEVFAVEELQRKTG